MNEYHVYLLEGDLLTIFADTIGASEDGAILFIEQGKLVACVKEYVYIMKQEKKTKH